MIRDEPRGRRRRMRWVIFAVVAAVGGVVAAGIAVTTGMTAPDNLFSHALLLG